MRFNTIPLFRIFGIQINLDYSWFIVFLLITVTLAMGYFPYEYKGLSPIWYWLAGALSAILLFASVLLHELSHSLVALHYGIPVKEINLFIFGGVALIEEEAPSPKIEFQIAIAGPICSFILGTIFLIMAYFYPYNDLLNGMINYLMIVNYIVAFFNLVPAFPLDGGRILRAIIWAKKDLLTATKISSMTGTAFAYFLMLLGILSLIEGSFINALWYGLIGLFLKQASKSSYEQTKLTVILSKYKVQNFLQTMKPIFPDETLYTVMTQYFPFYHTRTLPVLGTDGKFYIVDIEDIKSIPQSEWDKVKVIEIAKPIDVYVSPFDSLVKALTLMRNFDLDELPVIYENTFLGIIKRSTIETLLANYMLQEKFNVKKI